MYTFANEQIRRERDKSACLRFPFSRIKSKGGLKETYIWMVTMVTIILWKSRWHTTYTVITFSKGICSHSWIFNLADKFNLHLENVKPIMNFCRMQYNLIYVSCISLNAYEKFIKLAEREKYWARHMVGFACHICVYNMNGDSLKPILENRKKRFLLLFSVIFSPFAFR